MALVFAGASDRLEREQQDRAWLAWHTAALPRMKRFPALEQLLGHTPVALVQSEDAMRASMMAWADYSED